MWTDSEWIGVAVRRPETRGQTAMTKDALIGEIDVA
jgi:hypothetical protein